MLVFIQPTTVDNEPTNFHRSEYKNGEDNDRPLQMLAFLHPTTVDKEEDILDFIFIFIFTTFCKQT